MYDEQLIKNFMPKLQHLASKYANDTYDEDELLSEGQIYLLEYLANKQNCTDKDLCNKAYASVNNRLKTFTTKNIPDKIALNECEISISLSPICDSDKLIQLLENILTDKEFIIITEYYGILSNQKTCNEIAKYFGVSGSRISEIRRRAEYKIRREFYCKNISLDDLFI